MHTPPLRRYRDSLFTRYRAVRLAVTRAGQDNIPASRALLFCGIYSMMMAVSTEPNDRHSNFPERVAASIGWFEIVKKKG